MKYIFKKIICFLFVLIFICTIIVLLFITFHILTDPELVTTSYTVHGNVIAPIRIVQLSDLHNAEFGVDNADLIEKVAEQAPDLIALTGDMINKDEEDTSVVESLVCRLAEIAPVYYGYGNHETEWDSVWGSSNDTSISEIMSACGANVLEKQYKDVVMNSDCIRIAGYSGYYRNPVMETDDKNVWTEEKNFYDEFESTADYKILLNHIPTSWLDWHGINWDYNNGTNENDYYNIGVAIDGFDVNLVLSGHYHGGQWIIPLLGGIYAPGVGFNPPYYKGIFEGTKATCILSAGLGNEYGIIPRINNPPEIVVVDVLPE